MVFTKVGAVVGAMLTSVCASTYYAPHLTRLLADFYGNVWWPGNRIIHGADDFPDPSTQWPATATAILSPLALFPEWLAIALWVAASMASLACALWLAGCRDTRAYLVAFASPPVLCCFVLGNMTLMLVAGIAAVWVARDRHPTLAGGVVGAMVVMKVWLWPVAVFLVLTRRLLAASVATACGAAGIVAWWLLSPDTFYAYDDQTRETLDIFGRVGVGVLSIVANEGASLRTGVVVALVAGVVVLVLAWRASGDLAKFTLCLAAALVASPIVWAHYYAILFVPIAIRSPRLSGLWLVPYLSIGALLWPTLRLEFILASALSLAAVAIVALHIARPDVAHSTG